MKTNITLKIEADLLREARVLAALEGSSISALLAGTSLPAHLIVLWREAVSIC